MHKRDGETYRTAPVYTHLLVPNNNKLFSLSASLFFRTEQKVVRRGTINHNHDSVSQVLFILLPTNRLPDDSLPSEEIGNVSAS